MKRCRGTTLVEIIVVVAGCSAVMACSTALIHRLLTFSKRVERMADRQRTITRWSNDFRRDVGGSIAASLASDDTVQLLELRQPAGQITYRFDGNRIVRSHVPADTTAQQSTESYTFDPPSTCRVEPIGIESSPIVVTLEHCPPGQATAIEHLNVHAWLGRDWRFAQLDRLAADSPPMPPRRLPQEGEQP